MSPLATIVITALLSSALTIAAAWFVFERYLKPALIEALSEELAETGEMIEKRVRKGVVDGIAAAAGGEVLRDTTRRVTETGARVFEEGLGALLGTKKPGRSED